MENIFNNLNVNNLNILIATPCYNGQVYASYTESLLNTTIIFNKLGIKYTVQFIKNQIVTRARNMLTYNFLEEEHNFTHLLFIDADVVWQPQDIMFLLEHDKEITIGIYPNKAYDSNYNLQPSSVIKNHNIVNNLLEVKYAATGFMLIKKCVFNKIKKNVEQFYLPRGDEKVNVYNFFDCNVVNGDYLTEDYYFSHLYNQTGGTIYADIRIKLKHLGTHEYFSR